MKQKTVLTGISTTGTPHLGNYAGAIRPAIELSKSHDSAYFFLADLHSLIKCQDPELVNQSRLEIAATWMALGLDTDKAVFYRQSDIEEIPQITWLLNCVTAKGTMNRAHAYKAAVDENIATDNDPDRGITMGLFSYPVLMAADILTFNADLVPVGSDQRQHVEIAREIAQRFNHIYKDDFFVMPQEVIDDETAILPGLDGRKMSKSYHNTIPLFLPEKQLQKSINRIVTNSLEPGEPKDPDNAHLFEIYKAFASVDETQAFRAALIEGMGWGDAKKALFNLINAEIKDAREQYYELMAKPHIIEETLRHGAEKARIPAREMLKRLKDAVGLRDFI